MNFHFTSPIVTDVSIFEYFVTIAFPISTPKRRAIALAKSGCELPQKSLIELFKTIDKQQRLRLWLTIENLVKFFD
jgi:hypothetical protein